MYNVPGARLSPEIVAGVLRFCYGDTFTVNFYLDIKDQDGITVTIAPSDTVTLEVFDRSNQPVFDVEKTNITGNKFPLQIDESISGKMVPGSYSYRIRVKHAGEWTTVVLENKIIVR